MWGEWTTGKGFDLAIDVQIDDVRREMIPGEPMALVSSDSRYVQIRITRGKTLVFDERCPHDGQALRASVAVLARTIAATSATG